MSFFVGIPKSDELRKQLLMDAKQVIELLKNYEQYRETRRKKLEAIVQLKRMMEELMLTEKKMKAYLPKVTVPKKEEPKILKTTPARKAEPRPRKMTPAEQLEQHLARIEKKLETLE